MAEKSIPCADCGQGIPFGDTCWLVRDKTDNYGCDVAKTVCRECHD